MDDERNRMLYFILHCRDEAWEKAVEEAGSNATPTREQYEKHVHLNNATLDVQHQRVISEGIKKGDDILLTKGWSFYEKGKESPRARTYPRRTTHARRPLGRI